MCAAGIVALDLAALAVKGNQRVEQRQHGKALVAMVVRFTFSARMCDKAESAVLASHVQCLAVARCSASRQWSAVAAGCASCAAPKSPQLAAVLILLVVHMLFLSQQHLQHAVHERHLPLVLDCCFQRAINDGKLCIRIGGCRRLMSCARFTARSITYEFGNEFRIARLW